MHLFFTQFNKINFTSKKCYTYFLILFFYVSSLYAEENFNEPYAEENFNEPYYDEAVSLGYMCQVAQQLHDNHIRHHSYPLDWLVSLNFPGLINFIIHRGEGFLDLNHITFEGFWAHTHYLKFRDLLYNFELLHDFEEPFTESYEKIKPIFDRRVKRFFDLLDSDKKVLFVRLNTSLEQAKYLDYVLTVFYPKLTYTILVVNDHYENDWGLERVKNFQSIPIYGLWYGDHARWAEILSHFPVKKTTTPSELARP